MSLCFGLINGQTEWSVIRDNEGHREYTIIHRVHQIDTPGFAQGPASVLATAGLPIPGVSIWNIDGDFDVDAVCQWDARAWMSTPGERTAIYLIEQKFSTKGSPYCLNQIGTGTGTGNPATDPLGRAPIISGSFIKYQEEAQFDRNLDPILSSSFERLRGPQAEFDKSYPTVRVQMNQVTLDLPTLSLMIDTVNGPALWDFDSRCVKLSQISWQKKYYAGCQCYFEMIYEFQINIDTWDRNILDEGTKALKGKYDRITGVWTLIDIDGNPPDPTNPTHFVRFQDHNGNYARCILDGAGIPVTSVDDAGEILVEKYSETDFLADLGIPDSLEC